ECHHRDLHSFPTRRSSDLETVLISSAGFWCPLGLPELSSVSFSPSLKLTGGPTFRAKYRSCLREWVWLLALPWQELRWLYCFDRSEEHTSELQSRENLVCR